MANELVINTTKDGCRIALLKDGNLFEYHIDKEDNKFTVGDIYLGTIKKVVPSLNASFVDLGYHKDAFLHYLDLGTQFNAVQRIVKLIHEQKKEYDANMLSIVTPIDKVGKIGDLISKGQNVLVQIVKEPISNKGPRISSDLSLSGRYMILIPFGEQISISKKITIHKERERLQKLLTSIKPQNFGIIVRTAATGIDVAKLDRDLKKLMSRWDTGMQQLKEAVPGNKIIGEVNRTCSILRDMLNESFDTIYIDDKEIFNEIKQYIKTIAPEKEKIVKLHQGKVKLFEQLGIEKQLKTLFGQTVSVEGGGYLIIEHTEAMHVIDVNSGNHFTEGNDQVDIAMSVNMAATKEIARQLRLRDMGGIIVIDFIDVKNLENKRLVYHKMKEYMKEDRAKTSVLPLSKFGIMQITRQRIRPEMNLITREQCPSCNGKGTIDASILVADKIEKHLQLILINQNEKSVTLCLHPYLYAYFTKNYLTKRFKWFLKYKKWITLVEDSSMTITEFKFLNNKEDEIELTT